MPFGARRARCRDRLEREYLAGLREKNASAADSPWRVSGLLSQIFDPPSCFPKQGEVRLDVFVARGVPGKPLSIAASSSGVASYSAPASSASISSATSTCSCCRSERSRAALISSFVVNALSPSEAARCGAGLRRRPWAPRNDHLHGHCERSEAMPARRFNMMR